MQTDWCRPPRRCLGLAVLIGLSILASHYRAGASDTIYFKDGMRTVCEGNAREQDDEVHCDYDGGQLVYPKADVARIEKGRSTIEPPPETQPSAAPGAPESGAAPPPPGARTGLASAGPAQTFGGIAFYDPRRPRKYWSSATRHHDSLEEAVSALAEEYHRPAAWIEANLGDSNDLDAVHASLASRPQEPVAATTQAVSAPGRAIEFYNPRRTHKYMTAPDAPHASFQDALTAFAREFNQPVDWVERNMGTSNDVDQIRQSLRHAQSSAPDP